MTAGSQSGSVSGTGTHAHAPGHWEQQLALRDAEHARARQLMAAENQRLRMALQRHGATVPEATPLSQPRSLAFEASAQRESVGVLWKR